MSLGASEIRRGFRLVPFEAKLQAHCRIIYVIDTDTASSPARRWPSPDFNSIACWLPDDEAAELRQMFDAGMTRLYDAEDRRADRAASQRRLLPASTFSASHSLISDW